MAASIRFDEVSPELNYIGYGPVGAPENIPVWRIIKVSVIGTETKIEYANGSNGFNYRWSDRYSLSYL